MKQPITTDDIRPGDLIRWESTDPNGRTRAREYVATGREKEKPGAPGNLFLLARPPADLPEKVTLGCLKYRQDGVDHVEVGEWVFFNGMMLSPNGSVPASLVTGFVPGLMVDVELLEALGQAHRTASKLAHGRPHGDPLRDYWFVIDRFMQNVERLASEQAPEQP